MNYWTKIATMHLTRFPLDDLHTFLCIWSKRLLNIVQKEEIAHTDASVEKITYGIIGKFPSKHFAL